MLLASQQFAEPMTGMVDLERCEIAAMNGAFAGSSIEGETIKTYYYHLGDLFVLQNRRINEHRRNHLMCIKYIQWK